MSETTLATFRVDKETWGAFQEWAKSRGSNASSELNQFILRSLGRIDSNIDKVQTPCLDSNIDKLIDEYLEYNLDKHLDKRTDINIDANIETAIANSPIIDELRERLKKLEGERINPISDDTASTPIETPENEDINTELSGHTDILPSEDCQESHSTQEKDAEPIKEDKRPTKAKSNEYKNATIPGLERELTPPERALKEKLDKNEAQRALNLPNESTDKEVIEPTPIDNLNNGLTQAKLAERLGVKHPAVSTKKNKPTFKEWSKDRDPEGIAWQYQDEDKLFYPINPDLKSDT